MSVRNKPLDWKFEAFREYLSYRVLRNAAQVILLYEGENFNSRNFRIIEMQNLISERTNKNTWIPNRTGSNYLNLNLEGDIYRNKGRLLTSLLILQPKEMSNNILKLTEFGSALARGYINERMFYEFIVSNYRYPHPAYTESYNDWLNKKVVVLPFILILETLVSLYLIDSDSSYITADEVANFLYIEPNHTYIKTAVDRILESRRNNNLVISVDVNRRKITDILGFLVVCNFLSRESQNKFSLKLNNEQDIDYFTHLIDNAHEKHLNG